jgi:hypothetical protein
MMILNGMNADELGNVVWVKSRRSNSQGNCVQFAKLSAGGEVALRDSKDPHGPALIFSATEVSELVAGLKAGRFDHLVSDLA